MIETPGVQITIQEFIQDLEEKKEQAYEKAWFILFTGMDGAVSKEKIDIAKYIINRKDGMPKQSIGLSGGINFNPYENLTDAEKIKRAQSVIETIGANSGQDKPDISDGGNSGISEDGKNPQESGTLHSTSVKDNEKGNNLTAEKPLENNGDNSQLDNSTAT